MSNEDKSIKIAKADGITHIIITAEGVQAAAAILKSAGII